MALHEHIIGWGQRLVVVGCIGLLGVTPAIAQEAPVDDEVPAEDDGDVADPGPVDGPDVPDDEWMDDDGEAESEEDLRDSLLPDVDLEAPEDADPEFEKHLEGYREAYERYATAIDDYQQAIENLVETEFTRRMAEIEDAYDPRIREAQRVEQQQRQEAIESLEAFLSQYPDDAEHTPDALFRLALLYDQREQQEYEEAQADYFDQVDEIEQQDDPDYDELGDPPLRSYEDSQAMFQQLIADWPDYRGIDLAYYFMAHMEWEQGNRQASRDLSAALIREAPDSQFAPHAWLMVGEYYFEEAEKDGPDQIRDNLLQALDAFEEAASETGRANLTDDNYVRVVYSWAWTEYRLENYPQAIGVFRDVIELIDGLARETGDQRELLREDAMAHLAEILAMEDWELDGRPTFDDTIMARVEDYMSEGDDYEREVLVLLGEELFDFLRFDESIEVYEHVLEMDPLHPDNPEIHSRIVAALHRDYREEEAFAVRREMIDYYGEQSSWYEHQQRAGNEGALRDADNMVRDYLLMAATWYHEQAQTTRNEAMVTQDSALLSMTEEQYARAADAYEEFLKNYPNDQEIFQWNFYYAETLYYAARYREAYEQYRVVRELDIPDNPFQEVSAFNAIQALEFVMRQEVQEGELSAAALAGADLDDARDAAEGMQEERQVDEEQALEQIDVDGEPIPGIVEDYVTAMDRYVVLGLENPEEEYLGAKFAFQAGKVFHDYRHFDESRERFEWIVDNYPDHEVGYLAGSLILESFRQENDFEALTEWAERLEGVIEGEQAEAVRAEVRQYRLTAMFRAAEELIADEEYQRAAEEFTRLAREAPEHDLAPRALNNAASAYEVDGDYDQAINRYEDLFTEYPDHDYAGRAVYRVAVNSEWLFDYDKSVRHYQLFYDEFSGPTPEALEELNFDIEDRREQSLLQAAQMNEYLQRYVEAAERYEEFFETYPDNEFAVDTLWFAAEAWDKAGAYDEMIRVFDAYIDEFGDDPEHADRRIRARSRVADYYEDEGRIDDADEIYEEIVETVDAWLEEEQMPPGEAAIRERVAEAQFRLTERDFEEWDDIRIEGTLAQQERRLEDRIDGVENLQDQYRKVISYGNLDWNLAAFFRIGNINERMAEALYEVPNPFEEGSDEYWQYVDMLDDLIFPLEDDALARYRETISRARQHDIVNEWTERTLESLQNFEPEEYPYYEDEMRPRRQRIRQGIPLLSGQRHDQRQERQDWEDIQDLEAIDETDAPDDEGDVDDVDAEPIEPDGDVDGDDSQ